MEKLALRNFLQYYSTLFLFRRKFSQKCWSIAAIVNYYVLITENSILRFLKSFFKYLLDTFNKTEPITLISLKRKM